MKSFLILDLAAFAVGALSIFGFAGSYSDWNEERGFELAEECLIALNSECALRELNAHLGETGSPGGRERGSFFGNWVWALRLVESDGTLRDRVRAAIVDPDSEPMTDFDRRVQRGMPREVRDAMGPSGARLGRLQIERLADVSDIMAEMGMVGTARRHRELVAQTIEASAPDDEVVEAIELDTRYKSYRSANYGEFDPYPCSRWKELDWREGETDLAETPFNLEEQYECYLTYFQDRSAEELRDFIKANLEAMRTQRHIVGAADTDDLRGVDGGERYLHRFNKDDYIDRIAFLATIIAWRESRNGWGSGRRSL